MSLELIRENLVRAARHSLINTIMFIQCIERVNLTNRHLAEEFGRALCPPSEVPKIKRVSVQNFSASYDISSTNDYSFRT